MKSNKIASWITLAGGCIVLIIGIRHFPLAFAMAKQPVFAGLPANASDLLILLWFCVGILLVNFGVLSIYFSRKLKSGDRAARFFFLCVGIMFLFRTAFELMYPVAVPTREYSVLAIVFATSLFFLIPVALTGQSGPSLESSISEP